MPGMIWTGSVPRARGVIGLKRCRKPQLLTPGSRVMITSWILAVPRQRAGCFLLKPLAGRVPRTASGIAVASPSPPPVTAVH
jgi:hypothetical protein